MAVVDDVLEFLDEEDRREKLSSSSCALFSRPSEDGALLPSPPPPLDNNWERSDLCERTEPADAEERLDLIDAVADATLLVMVH